MDFYMLCVICYAVAMSIRRRTVCPSVFRTFVQHVLRYQFETWYMHSIGGTTCFLWVSSEFWPALRPKVQQTHFWQSWPHKSISILQIMYICGLLYTSRSLFCKKNHFRHFGDYFSAFWIFQIFLGFIFTCSHISIWIIIYTSSRWCHRLCSSFIPIRTLWPTLQPK